MKRFVRLCSFVVVLGWGGLGTARAQETAMAPGAASGFGAPGQLVFDATLQGGLNYSKTSVGDMSESVTSITINPSLMFMASSNLGVGGFLTFQNVDGDDASQTVFGLGPTAGFNLPIGPRLSFFPRATLGWVRVKFEQGMTEATQSAFVLGIGAPLLFHPADHLFFGVGPGFTYQLTSNLEVNGMDIDDAPKTTEFTLGFMIGGWL